MSPPTEKAERKVERSEGKKRGRVVLGSIPGMPLTGKIVRRSVRGLLPFPLDRLGGDPEK